MNKSLKVSNEHENNHENDHENDHEGWSKKIMDKKCNQMIRNNEIITLSNKNIRTILYTTPTGEYIPTDYIHAILDKKIVHYDIVNIVNPDNTHLMIKISINTLLQMPIINWKHNRHPDFKRCSDISLYLQTHKPYLDYVFTLAWDNETNHFLVIDGNHRYTSLKNINNNKLNTDWLINQCAIINVIFNANDGKLIELFKNINKSHPSEIYIRNESCEKLIVIHKVRDNFIALYNSHFSNKPNPQIPNVNIKKFHDLIDNLYDKYVGKVQEDMQTKIEQLLNDTNLNIKYMIETQTALQHIPKLKYTDKSLQKCIKSDCYLFLYKLDILEKYI